MGEFAVLLLREMGGVADYVDVGEGAGEILALLD